MPYAPRACVLQGLDLLACVSDDQRIIQQVWVRATLCCLLLDFKRKQRPRGAPDGFHVLPACTVVQNLAKATSLKFEFFQEYTDTGGQQPGGASGGGKVSIVQPRVDLLPQSDHALLAELVQRYHVDEQHR